MKSRCGGLLEIRHLGKDGMGRPCHSTVQFLHRTVREFLETKDAQAMLSSAIISLDFHPVLFVTMSYVTMLKREVFREGMGSLFLVQHNPYRNVHVWASIAAGFEHARAAEDADQCHYSAIIDELCHAGSRRCNCTNVSTTIYFLYVSGGALKSQGWPLNHGNYIGTY